jgi:hypothetical protein
MARLLNLVRVTTPTTGTGTLTLGGAVPGFLTFAQAGAQDADVLAYAIRDGNNSEIGYGTYTASGTTLTRTVRKSTNGDAAINLSGNAEVVITPSAEDSFAASAITYAGGSEMSATNVEAAIDELASEKASATDLTAHIDDATDAHDASAISFAPAGSTAATDVQAAIVEVSSDADAAASAIAAHISDASDAHDANAISYSNSTSGLAATDVQAAVDEIDGRVDDLEATTVVIASGSMPAAATLELTNIPDDFSYLMLSLNSLSSNTASRTIRVHGSVNNGSSYDTTNYNILQLVAGSSPSAPSVESFIDPAVAALATDTIFATLMIYAYQVDQARHCIADTFTSGGSGGARRFLSQLHTAVGALNALRVSWDNTGNFDAGTYQLIGVR